jgi:mannosylglycerate hydrolase
VANKGLHEYEMIRDEGDDKHSRFAVTLHRAVGYLSVSNGEIRRPQAGPSIPTPGAQCKRNLSAELCWGTASGNVAEVMRSARLFAHPIFVRQLPVIKNAPSDGPIPGSRSLLTLGNPAVQLSSLHTAGSDGDVIVRLYNPTDEDQACSIDVGFPATKFCESSLKEEWREDSKQMVDGGVAECVIKSNQIKTFRFRNDETV